MLFSLTHTGANSNGGNDRSAGIEGVSTRSTITWSRPGIEQVARGEFFRLSPAGRRHLAAGFVGLQRPDE
ncbi:hypothetical protein BRD03_08490 [Halobacteriales archaeon QS_9_68_17]|nr:MAG: hypothetical protein BRD03_08490 [Halobacteriales archaeon QS_9_68_17]